MDIEQDFLAHIFNDDIIYIIKDQKPVGDEQNAESNATKTSSVDPLKEDKITKEKNSEGTLTAEPEASYSTPKVLVLLADDPSEKEEILMNNILKAVNLGPSDIDRIYDHPAKFTTLKGTKLMLSFHANFAPNTPYEINTINGIQVIYAHDLGSLENNIDYKKQLWANLKKIVL